MARGPTASDVRAFRTLFAVGAAGMLTDGQLLERFATREGDSSELAFAALVERHGSMVLRVARGVTLDEHSAHDAFQATFLILARKARSLWVRDSLGPWLHSVAFRVASHSRSLEVRRKRLERDVSKRESAFTPDHDRADLARVLHEEIDRLPQPFRLAVVTCHLQGLTQQDAADRLGWPIGTLQSRLARGRQKLRGQLERRGVNPSLGLLVGHWPGVPPALTASTAKLAASWNLGNAITGMIAPTVLTMIETTTQGMLMTKLKFGIVAVVMTVGGIIGTGMATGVVQDPRITEGPPVAVPRTNEAKEAAKPKWHQRNRITQGEAAPTKKPDNQEIQPPSEGPGFPVLLDFHATWTAPCIQMRPDIARLVEAGYPIKTVEIDHDKSRLFDRYKVVSVPTFVLVDGTGHELNRLKGQVSAQELARFYNDNQLKQDTPEPEPLLEPAAPPVVEDENEPTFSVPVENPKPWETVVRIKIRHSEKEWGYGSGTVIASSADESIVLACAHNFRLKGSEQPLPKDYRVPIRVDLFNGQLTGLAPARVGRAEQDVVGQLIDYNFENDLALIRIRPGRKLPASRVVPASWTPKKGMKMFTVGCSRGEDATPWVTKILDPNLRMTSQATKSDFYVIKCTNQPKEGRSGGGLYTTEGDVAGVCNFADPNEHVGLYAVPSAIHEILDRNGLKSLYDQAEDPEAVIAPQLLPSETPAATNNNEPIRRTAPAVVPPAESWMSGVRIDFQFPGQDPVIAAGTVIRSTPRESIVLLSSRTFWVKGKTFQPTLESLKGTVKVELLDGQPGGVGGVKQVLPGEVIAIDHANRVALVRIKPGQQLPASKVVPADWNPKQGMKVVGSGWLADNRVIHWETEILDPNYVVPNDDSHREWIGCDIRPASILEGSGLFTRDGYLAGVCQAGDGDDDSVGLYVQPDEIRRMLDHQGMKDVYLRGGPSETVTDSSVGRAPIPEPSSTLSEPVPTKPDPRIDELEKKLDRVMKALEGLKGVKALE